MRIPRSSRDVRASAVATTLALVALTACTTPGDDARPDVLASFYPLQYVAEEVGGGLVDVRNLTPATAEAHNLELSPAQVREIGDASVVLYLSGFQVATDEAVAAQQPERVVDAAAAAGLESGPNGPGAGVRDTDALDPHFWLDPTRLAAVGHQLAEELSAVDPRNAATYASNAAALESELTALDAELADGLAGCVGATLVVSHEAFGYLAERYDLRQVGITGINPEVEPSPARLRDVRAVVEDTGVRTLFFEVLTSPKVTQTLADDLGVVTDVLDPIEGRVSPDADYLDIMRSNLDALQRGLVCETVP